MLSQCSLMRHRPRLTGINHPTDHWMTSNYTPGVLSWYPVYFGKMSLYNVPHQWCSGPRKMIMVWICYLTVLCVLYEAWTTYDRGESPITPQSTVWPPTTCSAVTQVFGIKSLNHGPHQWCSGPRMMVHGWIFYPTISWALYEACTMSDRSGSPHSPQHHLGLHPRYA